MLDFFRILIINRLTQLTSWIGFIMIVMAFIAPRPLFIDFGIVLIVMNDERMLSFFGKLAPGIKAKLERPR